MLYRYIAVFFILGIGLAGNFPLTQSCWAETLVQSTVETRLVVGLRVGQSEVQKLVKAPWQVAPPPGGPLKDANFMFVFIDQLLVQDAQGKPDMGGINRYVVFQFPQSIRKPERWPLSSLVASPPTFVMCLVLTKPVPKAPSRGSRRIKELTLKLE